ncbi:hypothetical protein LA303_08035 [Candidatus Sulfidibacterium hydrothermale]|uniref:hypothetical protein n=1 Tax=Candidatus Sulfidibacterium hydrothermale TaxID=2875962 RepID=UPI001F0A31ED|nr:hypothetical protein [Candidatus Sulfidibacterium hydrothermale]UBM61373.1 hypothetical protein LA303_08035 [Candidatus Sulfidibacterium hydrothermale]
MTKIRFATFPRTIKPKDFSLEVVKVFEKHYKNISTVELPKGLDSDTVLSIVRNDLEQIGFEIEKGKKKDEKIYRPVFFGENAQATVKYEIDGFHNDWKCGLEVEAGRAWMGNAVYRDIVQSLVMVELEHLILAVPQTYKYKSKGKDLISRDYENARNLIDTIYNHSRFQLPYDLTLIGY